MWSCFAGGCYDKIIKEKNFDPPSMQEHPEGIYPAITSEAISGIPDPRAGNHFPMQSSMQSTLQWTILSPG
jgi:hypothetical protein